MLTNGDSSVKTEWSKDKPPHRGNYKGVSDFLRVLKIWIEEVASIEGIQCMGANLAIASIASDQALSIKIDQIRSAVGRCPVKNQNEADDAYLARIQTWANNTFVTGLSNVANQVDKNLVHNLICHLIWTFAQIVKREGLSLKEMHEAFCLLITQGITYEVVFTDRALAYRFWICLPEDIQLLANTKPERNVQVNNNNVVQNIKYSYDYQRDFVEEVLKRAAIDSHHCRYEWVAYLSNGTLSFFRGKQEKKIKSVEEQVVRAANLNMEQLLDETLCRAFEVPDDEDEDTAVACAARVKEFQNKLWQKKRKFEKWEKKKFDPEEKKGQTSLRSTDQPSHGSAPMPKGSGNSNAKDHLRKAVALLNSKRRGGNKKSEKVRQADEDQVNDNEEFINQICDILTFDDEEGTTEVCKMLNPIEENSRLNSDTSTSKPKEKNK